MRRSGPPARRTPLKAKAPLRSRSAGRAAASATSRERSPGEPQRTAAPDQGSGVPPRKRLPQRSAARVAEDEAWRDVKLAVRARDGHECRAAALVPDVACGGRLHPHHLWPTGRGGPRLDPANVLTVCAVHHRWAHDGEPARARAIGLLRSGP